MDKTRVIVSDVYVVDTTTKEETRIHGEMVFGRAEVDKNFPKDTLISRRHFRLVPADDVVMVEDLGSTNRTKVNGKLLKPSTLYKLKSRDVIEFGQQKFQVFIGGKIVEDATKVATPSEGAAVPAGAQKLPDRSIVFERFTTHEEAAAMSRSGEGLEGIEGLEIHSESEVLTDKDDMMLQNLVQKKNSAWYLQFSGSEFGPLSLKELKTLVHSKQFQGGELFAFTEGLADWMPIAKLSRYLDEPGAEFTATRRISGGTPLTGKISCFLKGTKSGKLEGRLDSITLSELTFTLKDPLMAGASLFDVEVIPEEISGVEPFKATVKLDPARSLKNTHTVVVMQAAPRAKMSIERFLRAKG